MSYGYQPRFDDRGLAGFRALDPWLREEGLDEVDRLLASVPAPDVAQRLAPHEMIDDLSRTAAGVEHVVFLSTLLDVPTRQLRIRQIGHVTRP